MGWESWEDWEAWEEGGGSGPAPTYTISGTITGDEVSGVTVALTGDATDSVVTAGDGTYSFTGLSNGSYTVTPTLAGYNFTPAATNVTVADGDQTGKDFVSAENTYTISGSIVDGAAAGIEGVTVTLSGDADDSTTTDGDGAYSFTGLVDGDYTVTPTKAGAVFTPTSRDVAVAAADVVVDDIVGVQYLVLPYTYNFSSMSIANTVQLVGNETGFDSVFYPGSASPTAATSSLVDSHSYTPSGVTKVARFPVTSAAQNFSINGTLGNYVNDLTVLRMACLYVQESDAARGPYFQFGLTNADSSQYVASRTWEYTPDSGQGGEGIFLTTGINGGVWTRLGQKNGNEFDHRFWYWCRIEIDFANKTIQQWHVRDEEGQSADITNGQATGVTDLIDVLTSRFNAFHVRATYWDTNCVVKVAKIWIGTGDDDWPV